MRSWKPVLLTLPLLSTLLAPGPAPAETPGPEARAVLHGPEGKEVGTVTFSDTEKGVAVHIQLHDFLPGVHAFHIHGKGACEAPDFLSAGGHFNPTEADHGFLSLHGPHAGDLPNIDVSKDGTLDETFVTQRISLDRDGPDSILREGGTSVMIHEKPDDYLSNPAGDAGPRIACGVIEAT